MAALDQIASWEVPNVSGAVVGADGTVLAAHGDIDHPFRLASITKVVVGWTAMIAIEEGVVALDDPAGQPGCTLRHLLAHAGGYAFDGADPIGEPGRRRIYSNTGIEVAAAAIEQSAGITFATYLDEAVLQPLGMAASELRGSPAHGMWSSVRDLMRLLEEFQRPTLISFAGATECVTVQYPDLGGIVPGVGRFDPCPWGLGIEIRGDKMPHWTGTNNSPATFGHFGGAGTMTWVDPVAGCGLVALTDRPFDDWPEALGAWRTLSDDVLAEVAGGPSA
jgi:CubicO group peptidase (beta-lactamase class C family)